MFARGCFRSRCGRSRKFEAIWDGGGFGFGFGGRGFAAFLLKSEEFGGGLFELIAEAAFLQGEVAEVFLISAEDVGFEHGGAELGVRFLRNFGGEFGAAEGVETRFESRDAEEAPFGVGDRLREVFFVVVGGGEFLTVAGPESATSFFVAGKAVASCGVCRTTVWVGLAISIPNS